MSIQKELPWSHVHFTGIGGVGMCGLAHILLDFGVHISGSDSKHSEMLQTLINRGAQVQVGHDPAMIQNADMLVHSSAVQHDNVELQYALEHAIPHLRRGAFLAELGRCFETVIAVAGSHGKTTTTAMITHILRACNLNPGFLVGGSVQDLPRSAMAGAGKILVTEVDESDGTQALMHSSVGVVVNVEDDHCWSLGGIEALEKCFADFAEFAEQLICWDTDKTRELFANHHAVTFVTAAERPPRLKLRLPGEYNRVNATLAYCVAASLGIEPDKVIAALGDFGGVTRRMTEHFRAPDAAAIIVEDYAHHPTELRAALQALREAYAEHELIMIFQPHRFERVKRYGSEFAAILQSADRVVVVSPFAAWLNDDDSGSAAEIAAAVVDTPCEFFDGDLTLLAQRLTEALARGSKQLFAVIGAGDVCDLIPSLKQLLIHKFLSRQVDILNSEFPALDISRTRTWAELTTLGIGRAQPLLIEVANEGELQDILVFAEQRNIQVFVLGAGSNLIGSDESQPQFVLRLRGEFASLQRHGTCITVGAGLTLNRLCRQLAAAGALAAQFAPLCWIPATAGGAVRMNAGAQKAQICEWVRKICGVRSNGAKWVAAGTDLVWSYRHLEIPADVIITHVELDMPNPSSAEAALQAIEQTGMFRRRTQPRGRSAGCVFRNPGRQSAGALLDRSGCKGLRVGGCHVSTRHANFILAERDSTATDFTELTMAMQRRVYEATGIVLRPEVQWVSEIQSSLIQRQIESLQWEQ